MKATKIFDLALKGIAAAMGLAVIVLASMKTLDINSSIMMLGIGLSCLSISFLNLEPSSDENKVDR